MCILQRERNHNRKITLDVAIKRLRDLYILANETNYDPDPDSEDESKMSAEESECDTQFIETIPLSYFIVSTIPQHILSDPVAFNRFLKLRNSIPSYERSGPFSRKSIQALQAAYGQGSLASHDKHSQVAEESTVIAESICTITVDGTSQQSESIAEADMYNRSEETVITANEVPSPDLWSELPFQNDVIVDPTSGVAAIERMAVNARTEMSSETLEAVDCELEVLSIVDEGMEWYQNSTGEKAVEKWREKDCCLGDSDEKDVCMIDLGAKMDSCAQDLVDSGWKPDVVEAAVVEDEERLSAVATSGELRQCAERINHGTTEELESSGGSYSSDCVTSSAIQTPTALPIQTPSEWNPSSDNLEEAILATGVLSTAFWDLQFVNPGQQGVAANFRSPTTVMVAASLKLKEPDSGYQILDSADVSSPAIRNPVVQQTQTASKWDPGPDVLTDTIPAIAGKEVYAFTIGGIQVVKQHRADLEPDLRSPGGILVKTIPHDPTHPVAEFLWPPEDGVRQALSGRCRDWTASTFVGYTGIKCEQTKRRDHPNCLGLGNHK